MSFQVKPVHIHYTVDFKINLPDGMTEEEYENYIKDFSIETDLDEGDISLANYTPYEEYSQE